MVIVVDQTRARRAGVTSKEAALSLQSHLDGVKITEYRELDIAIPVLGRSVEEERRVLGDLWNVMIRSPKSGVLAFVGGFIGLYIMQAPFDFFGMLGLLSLAGVIINNGIVLIDKIDSERAAGREPYDAVVMAALSRFRPITMATITTILGVMPLIVSVDPLFYAMACIIAFGLAVGTVLTLGVAPVIYSIFFRVKAPTKTTTY